MEFRNLNVKVDYNPTSRVSAFVRGGYFSEERDNAKKSTFDGTPEGNDTTWTSASGGVRILILVQNDRRRGVFTDHETFKSNFMAVAVKVGCRVALGADDAQSARADQQRGVVWCSGVERDRVGRN